MRRESVPLAVDAEIRFSLGVVRLPLRAVVLLGLVSPLAITVSGLPFLRGAAQVVAPLGIWILAGSIALPQVEGIWAGTWVLYRLVAPLIPSVIAQEQDGKVRAFAARVSPITGVGMRHEELPLPDLLRPLARRLALAPRAITVDSGMFELAPGGWRAVLSLEGPTVATTSDEYGHWVGSVVRWLSAVGVPAQFYARSVPCDRVEARQAFEITYRGLSNWRKDQELKLVGDVASKSLSLTHYIVFSPDMAGPDGVPFSTKMTSFSGAPETSREEVERVLERAENLVGNHGLKVVRTDHEEIAALLRETPLHCATAAVSARASQIGSDYVGVITLKALPADVDAGMLVRRLLKNHVRGTVSVYLAPMDGKLARSKVDGVRKDFNTIARKNDDLDADAMAASATSLALDLVQRRSSAYMAAVTVLVRAASMDDCDDVCERLVGALQSDGLRPVRCYTPGFAPALAGSPGCPPLGRSLLRPVLTDAVVACLLPAMGTPFSRPDEPYVGHNMQTGTPAYLNVFRGRDNMNLTCIGQMGKGKSVAMKTLLYRHACKGVRLVVIDPHSEYRGLMDAVDGVYLELGTQSVNPLAVGTSFSPDQAAGMVGPALSVMAGDEVGTSSEGYPVRRLRDEDKGWLHGQVARFFQAWRAEHGDQEPVLSNLLAHMADSSTPAGATTTERDRARRIMDRLAVYTQDPRAEIFDRPMKLQLGGRSVAFGMFDMANRYGADLTPALAVILGWVLREMMVSEADGMLVMVDEAHYILDDPDAGSVLNRMVRGVRKRGVGVWMASQQVEDFLSENGLGKTLAANSDTKLVMGIDRSVAAAAQEALGLTDAEVEFLTTQSSRGDGVLISGPERAIVHVHPGNHLEEMVTTTSLAQSAHR